MPNSQTPYEYTKARTLKLLGPLSQDRIMPYYSAIHRTPDKYERLQKAFKLYEKNTEYSEAMYPVLQGFEIAMRNRVHDCLTKEHGAGWYDKIELLPLEKNKVAQAKTETRLTLEGRPVTHGKDLRRARSLPRGSVSRRQLNPCLAHHLGGWTWGGLPVIAASLVLVMEDGLMLIPTSPCPASLRFYALGDFANIKAADGAFLPQLGSVALQAGRHRAEIHL
jgi:hypothetical protein